MNPEERRLLERAVTLSEENNNILRGIRRANRLGFIWKIVYWIVILAVSYGAYVYIQPYVDQVMKVYQGTVNTSQKVSSQFSGLENFFKKFQQ
ncbi:MAG: hypothetical protein AAB511_02540 [Patescibacteria group bacterium]